MKSQKSAWYQNEIGATVNTLNNGLKFNRNIGLQGFSGNEGLPGPRGSKGEAGLSGPRGPKGKN